MNFGFRSGQGLAMQATRTAILIWAPVLYASVVLSAGTATAQVGGSLRSGSTTPNSYYDLSVPGSDNAVSRDFDTSQLATNLFEDEGGVSWNPQSVQGGESVGSAVTGGDSGSGGGDLSSQILDPTKPLYQLQFQHTFGSSLYGNDSTLNSFQFQPVIPHKSFGFTQIVRATLSYQMAGPGEESLQPAQLFNLFVIPGAGGTFGVGPLFNFSPSFGPDSDTFQLGPAGGWVGQKGKLTYGLFNQNLFSDNVALTQLQPVLGYAFNEKWSASMGNIQLTYDWKNDQWTQLPLGVQINRIAIIRKSPVRFFYNPQYNFRDLPGNTRWQHVFGVSLLTQ